MELSIAQNVETASRFERAQSATRAHLARARGNLQLAEDELIKINRDRLHQCVSDQLIEFNGRKKVQNGRISYYCSGRYLRPMRSPSGKRNDR